MSKAPDMMTLRAGSTALSLIPSLGGQVQSLVLPFADGAHECLSGAEPPDDNPAYRGALLFPFPNRLRDGRYRWGNRDYQFAVNEAPTQTALHGFLFKTPGELIECENGRERSSARVRFDLDGADPGYPFRARVEVFYEVAASGELTIRFRVENPGNEPIPAGLGWHPYFQLGAPVDELGLQMPESRRLLVDDRMLPTGETRDEPGLARLAPIGPRVFDDCFELVRPQAGASVCVYSQAGDRGLQLWQAGGDGGMNFLQLYTPPDRQSIAVEPMSCAIDAMNTGVGLAMIEPGQCYEGVFGVRPWRPERAQ